MRSCLSSMAEICCENTSAFPVSYRNSTSLMSCKSASIVSGDLKVLTHLKHRVDSQVLSNSHLMDNEPYFMQGMFPMIKQELDAQHLKYSAVQIKYIGTCISNEYFTERNFAS